MVTGQSMPAAALLVAGLPLPFQREPRPGKALSPLPVSGPIITDSNGSLSSGSGIGGGTFGSSNPAATVWLTAFTLGVAPQVTPASAATTASQFFTGRIGFSYGAPLQNPGSGVPAPALHSAVRARTPLTVPPRGRVYSNPGGPVSNPGPVQSGPVFFPKNYPARARIVPPPRGRIYFHAGAPLKNPGSGPVFKVSNHPVRAVIPKNVARGIYVGFNTTPPQASVLPISFNVGNANTADTATSVTLGIPAGVLPADAMLLAVTCYTEDPSAPAISISGGGGTWNLIGVSTGTNPEVASQSGAFSYLGSRITRIANGAADPGATLTISETGSGAGSTWWAVSLASYTGAAAISTIDVAGGASAAGGSGTTVTCPAETTTANGDWAVYLGGGGIQGTGFTIPAGSTQRENLISDAGVGTVIADSNGNFPPGSSIGGGTFGAPVAGAVWVTAFTVGLSAFINPVPPQDYAASYATGRIMWSAGAALGNPLHPGPVFYQLNHPVQAKALPRMRGHCRAIRFVPLTSNPSPGPPVYPLQSPIRAQLPVPFLKGRVYANKGAAARNPSSGPVFRQATQPVRRRITLPPRGRAYSNPGGPVINPGPLVAGPPVYPLQGPVRSKIPQNAPRGRIYSNPGAPVHNPSSGPVFRQATTPAIARIAKPFSKGRVYSNPGAPVKNPVVIAAVTPLHAPVRGRITPPARGRVYSNAGIRVFPQSPVYPLKSPVRAHPVLPPRGRIYSNQGIKVLPSAPLYPLQHPIRAQFPLPPRGRIYSNRGGPLQNPLPPFGPPFFQKNYPVRVHPTLPPRGRIAFNKGAPVHNPQKGPVFPSCGSSYQERSSRRMRRVAGSGVTPVVRSGTSPSQSCGSATVIRITAGGTGTRWKLSGITGTRITSGSTGTRIMSGITEISMVMSRTGIPRPKEGCG